MLCRNRAVHVRNIITDIFLQHRTCTNVSKKYSEHTEHSNWMKQLMVKDNCSLFEIWKLCCKLHGEVQRTKHAELDSLKMSKLKANYDNLLSYLNFEKSVNAKIMKRSGNCCFKVEGFFCEKGLFWFCKAFVLASWWICDFCSKRIFILKWERDMIQKMSILT